MNWLKILLLPTLLYYLLISSFLWVFEESCENPEDNFAKCLLLFEITFKITNTSLLKWETIYEGHWNNSQKHGHGTYLSFSRNSYTGDWKYGKRDGFGVFTIAQDGIMYEGEWVNDEFVGEKNKIRFPIKVKKVEGELLKEALWIGNTQWNLPEGKGKLSFGNGQVLEGIFSQGFLTSGVFTLGGKLITLESTTNSSWDILGYKANMNIGINGSTLAVWDGKDLVPFDESLAPLLLGLKWFEYYVNSNKHQVEAEIYHFHHQA